MNSNASSPAPSNRILERLTVTLYGVDEDVWGRFRLALLQRDLKLHEGLYQAVETWLKQNPPRIAQS